jgi:hypothetical protein
MSEKTPIDVAEDVTGNANAVDPSNVSTDDPIEQASGPSKAHMDDKKSKAIPQKQSAQVDSRAPESKKSGKRGGGPKTAQGKSISSMNAVKTGLHVSGWIDDQEKSEYESLFTSLQNEYGAHSPTMLVQIERMASTAIKLRRLQKVESALWHKARQLANRYAIQRPAPESGSEDEKENATHLAELTAMPDPDRLAILQRHQTSLDRQLSKVVGEIQVLTAAQRIVSREKNILPHASVTETTVYANGSLARTSFIQED